MTAIIEGTVSNSPITKTLNGKEITWFTISIKHYPRPGEPERNSFILAEVRNPSMSDFNKNDRLKVYGNFERFSQDGEQNIKIIVSEIVQLNVRQRKTKPEEQGVLFV